MLKAVERLSEDTGDTEITVENTGEIELTEEDKEEIAMLFDDAQGMIFSVQRNGVHYQRAHEFDYGQCTEQIEEIELKQLTDLNFDQ